MKVTKHGKRYTEIEFKCTHCGCEFIALDIECDKFPDFWDKQGRLVRQRRCQCPECYDFVFSYKRPMEKNE